MNRQSLHRQINQALEQAQKLRAALHNPHVIQIDREEIPALFSPDERKRYGAFLQSLKASYGPSVDIRELPEEHLEQLDWWACLHKALEDGNQDDIWRYRLRLSISYEELVQWFRTRDINQYPQSANHQFTRTGYRHMLWCLGHGYSRQTDFLFEWYEREHRREGTHHEQEI